nr:uncharacterized protein LOC124811356 [Hydra vulgaris]
MNNYNYESGNFQDKEFVHVKAETICSLTIYNCSCKTFSSCFFFQSKYTTNVNNCCHCRLLNQLMQMLNDPEFIPENSLLSKKKLINSLIYLTSNVLKLTFKSGVERYSVVADSCAFVTIFEILKSSRKVIKCHDSECQVSEGSIRQINNLQNGCLCPHLKVFREYFYLLQNTGESISNEKDEVISNDSELEDNIHLPREKWEDVFNVASGLWRINAPSKKTFSHDQFNKKFSSDIVNRQSATNGHRFIPSIDLGICNCGVNQLLVTCNLVQPALQGWPSGYKKLP